MVQVKRSGNMRRVEKVVETLSKKKVEVGIFNTSHYPDGTPVAYVAAIQEWGYPQGNIQARSFFRTTIEEQKPNWGRQVAGATQGAIEGKVDINNALEGIGGLASGDIGRKVTQIFSPALKESTLRNRRYKNKSGHASDKPLVDSGLMLQSITHKVSKK